MFVWSGKIWDFHTLQNSLRQKCVQKYGGAAEELEALNPVFLLVQPARFRLAFSTDTLPQKIHKLQNAPVPKDTHAKAPSSGAKDVPTYTLFGVDYHSSPRKEKFCAAENSKLALRCTEEGLKL